MGVFTDMNKQFIAIVIVIVFGLFGILYFTKDKNTNSGGAQGTSNVAASNHVDGPDDAKVTLLEYGDFQCPACGTFYPLVEKIREEYGDRIKFQFRNYPLVQIHPNAFIASRAAEAAEKQGKFFEMYNLLYKNQQSWTSSSNAGPIFEGYAQQLNLNAEQFKTDMESAGVADIINADVRAGQEAGVNSTPTFFINGKKIDKNPTSEEAFKKLIDDALAE
jgi:protein-disulfide isomerase